MADRRKTHKERGGVVNKVNADKTLFGENPHYAKLHSNCKMPIRISDYLHYATDY